MPWPLIQWLAVWSAAAALMSLLAIRQRRSHNASSVDVAWALGVGGAAVFLALTSPGDPLRRILVGGFAGLWSVRLGFYLWNRIKNSPEDGRYKELRARWGDKADRHFDLFFQAQAAFVAIFAIPFLPAVHEPSPLPLGCLIAAGSIFAISLLGESLADRQLAAWRQNPENRGKTCRQGLWRYSRHPNYFFEWLHWFAYPLLAVNSPWWPVAALAPAVMLLFLFRLTGIPYTEAQALKSRGEDYRRYQRETSAFIPWFPASSFDRLAMDWVDRGWIPDFLIRRGIRALNARRLAEERGKTLETRLADLRALEQLPLAVAVDKANEQHYAIPAPFFEKVLGRHLKYSACDWDGAKDLDQAEANALQKIVERAQIEDGQAILELGCGWGSLSLYLAERFPRCRIVGVSNSPSQKRFIADRCAARKITNLQIITADINHFSTDERFDRIVSVEMFEHVRNHRRLFERLHGWLKPNGALFVHIFCHKDLCYTFETEGEDDWMGRHFFTGGIMPSFGLLSDVARAQGKFHLARSWEVSGTHYQKTAEAWLERLDANRAEILPLFETIYGRDARRWFQRWRVFFMACAELFGAPSAGGVAGAEWQVGHYFWKNAAAATQNSRERSSATRV